MCRVISIVVALVVIAGCSAREYTREIQKPTGSHYRVKNESSAQRIVEKYIKESDIDMAGLKPVVARRMDTTGKTSSLPAGFGSELWVVRYAPIRKQGEEITLGGGVLFWVDAASGKIYVTRERD